ncbi:toll/interleukin-1 receptor domain-containing protein [Flexithrix dorotheae]|uniref:toll/interleukin-1 receptor domain-containing protein n=1 Tax=Flexithrix dorotheae TaxID=70993 RepID=UPI000362DEBF|nr:toll/interleukin-1 receptor domain-containing protein [Flexithrix dorotheae]
MPNNRDIFISYGRGNEQSKGSKAFAIQLHQILEGKGYAVWLDKEDIPLGVDYQQEIDEGIKGADNFLFIISPHAVKSAYCYREVQLAVELNKRIIPILHVLPSNEVVEESTHPTIKRLNWIPFDQPENLEESVEKLIEVIQTDRAYITKHTELISKASDWAAKGRHRDFLLRKSALKDAEKWIKAAISENKEPAPPELLEEFISKSRRVSRYRFIITSVSVVALILFGSILSMALWFKHQQQKATLEAFHNMKRAQSNKLIAKTTNQCEDEKNPAASLQVAALAYKVDEDNEMAKGNLLQAYYQMYPPQISNENLEGNKGTDIYSDNQEYHFYVSGNEIMMATGNGEEIAIFTANESISQLDYKEKDQLLLAETSSGTVLQYNLDLKGIVSSLSRQRGLPGLSKKQIQKYGIDVKELEDLGLKVSLNNIPDIPEAGTLEKTEVKDKIEERNNEDKTVNKPNPARDPVTNPVDEIVSKVDEFSEIMASTDKDVLSEAFKDHLNLYQKSNGAEKVKYGEELIAIGQKAKQLFPADKNINTALGKSYDLIGWEYLKNEKYGDALENLEKANQINTADGKIKKDLIIANLLNGNLTKATIKATPMLDQDCSKISNYSTYRDWLIADLNNLSKNGNLPPEVSKFTSMLQSVPLQVKNISINNGSEYTYKSSVNLKFDVKGATEMMISNVPTFADGTKWEPYSAEKSWNLTPNTGLKKVFVKFRDFNGQVSRHYTASIVLSK